MKNNKIIKRIFFTLNFIILLSITPVKAQCSLCQSQVESSLNEGSNKAKGLNSGIFILLVSPYVFIGTIAFIWYRKNKKAKAIS